MNPLKTQILHLLQTAGIESPQFEAAQISEFAGDDQGFALTLAQRRIAGEPLQYVLGEWEFYGLPFAVGSGVLIPRPDTEHLVDAALRFLKQRPETRVADLCAGSGCVGLAIAKNAPRCAVTAVEKSPEAFAYLQKNIAALSASVEAVQADILEGGFGQYGLIVSNPPYIASGELPTLQAEVQQEPKMALDGGEDGLVFYRGILEHWLPHLERGGALMVEIGFDQAAAVTALFAAAGLENLHTLQDYGKNDRVIIGTLPR